ncbi:hypothetical protein [Streptomyces puniciscabiei]|uniref:hypothetical protein n=1 Tax=Streptomyces puniciscabiei TaxID=164348 RepID=UPI00378ED615
MPLLAGTVLDLAGRGLLDVRRADGPWPESTDPVLSGQELRRVLTDPEQWIPARASAETRLAVGAAGLRARWQARAFPAPASGGFPHREEWTEVEETLLICTLEVSGWLTGPFGVLQSPEEDWSLDERLAWVEPQIAPLVRWVEQGWIEVYYFPGREEGFTVVPAGELLTTLAGPAVWHEDDDWGAGVTCEFTDAGLGAWRG